MAYTFTPFTDGVDYNDAADVNALGTALNALDFLTLEAATELTVAAGVITLTQACHKLQPQAGAADDIDTISGMDTGDMAVLYASDAGVDTLTFRHGVDNISCAGAADIGLSEGAIICYYDGAIVYISGGGGTDLVDDLTPQLGGDLDLNGNNIDFPTTANISDVLDEDDMATDSATMLATQQSIKAYVDNKHPQNFLINGSFRVAQRGTTFTGATTPANSDDTYLLDRWILLSDGNDIVDVSQETTVIPDGAKASIKLEVETANKQFGILQILENKDAMAFSGKQASLSFQARMAAADDNTHSLKAIVLAWDGAADTVTSDVVNAWLATCTFVANWTGENAPGSNTLTTSWQTFTIEDISIDTASMANLAVFIYCDQTDGVIDDAIYITGVKLEIGETATDFVARAYEQEFSLSQRYYEIMVNNGASSSMGFMGYATTGNPVATTVNFAVKKRANPTMSIVGVWTVFNCGQPSVRPSASTTSFILQGIITAAGFGYFLSDSAEDAVKAEIEL